MSVLIRIFRSINAPWKLRFLINHDYHERHKLPTLAWFKCIKEEFTGVAHQVKELSMSITDKGENSAIQECSFWLDTLDTPILPYETELTTSIPLEPESTVLPPEPESTIPPEIEPNTNSSTPARTQPLVVKELIVYSRRKQPQEEIEDRTLPEQNHESDPSPDIPGLSVHWNLEGKVEASNPLFAFELPSDCNSPRANPAC
ncbi:hypothetical protein LWI29_017951 [Acer saccharum]|uniref:Uncharacterized protein n=1 Tax=Acer saccharum TaxID=4024 RepID=A0AA39SSV7_ACESA|nr:hypothetical protein LWI29_017951 [Acer saccharum]